MQLALTPEVLFPLGACAVVAVAVIVVVVVLVRGRRTDAEDASAPTAADWTGEAATADPTPTPTVTVPALPQRLTVAEAIAVREADTAPLPVSSVALLGTRPATAPLTSTGPLPRVSAVDAPAAPADPEAVPAGAVPEPAEPAGPTDAGPTDAGPTDAGPTDAGPTDARPAGSGPADSGHETAREAERPVPEPDEERRATTEPTGSGPTVAAAVAHALAARAASARGVTAPAPVPGRTADARDRLLAVLLADPARAVGAAEELATCRGRLSDVLARLAQSGLSTAQLARLSGFTVEQVTTLLAQQGADR